MSEQKKHGEKAFELRLYLTEAFANAARNGQSDPAMKPLQDVLDRHGAKLKSELHKIQDFLLKKQKVTNWEEQHPRERGRNFLFNLEAFALRTICDESKREYLARDFYVSMNGRKMFRGDEADDLIRDLESLKSSGILGTGPRINRGREPGVRKVYFPKHHPGTRG